MTDAIKSFAFPEVNAEACDDEEPFDREEILDYNQEEFDEEKEFGTIGDDQPEVVIIVYL